MKKLHVNTALDYDIFIEAGILDRCGDAVAAVTRGRSCVVITDSNVGPLYAERVCLSLENAGFTVHQYVFPAGESSKSMGTYGEILEFLASRGLTRTDCVVALGGGVTGDMAGFAAATYLRGIDYIQIPTTLLSQVDSSVGGKTAIDLRSGKNLAGAFYQPKLVLMDPLVLDTLPDAVFSDGMAEVIKYGCIWDKGFFDFLYQRPGRQELMRDIEYVLYTCCDIKRQVVEKDEHDHGLRMILNFGHTIGHAYELAGHYETYTHGQAVSAGMCAAFKLGVGFGVTENEGFDRLTGLLQAFDLPVFISCGRHTMTAAIGLDKKSDGDDITMIFLRRLGKAVPHRINKMVLYRYLDTFVESV